MTLPHAPPRHEIASLDGLRAVSVVIVLVSHAGLGHVVPGGLGVTTFFFLSGFLITTLLRRELAATGTVHIGRFYLRRMLRLGPPLLLMLAIAYGLVLAGPLLGGTTWQGLAAQLLYFANYYTLFFDPGDTTPHGTGVLWSLAVEEHFYLVYPLLFLGLMRSRRPAFVAGVFGLLCLAVLLWRMYLVGQPGFHYERTYYASDTRMDAILLGCIMALVAHPLDLPPAANTSQPGRGELVGLGIGLLLVAVSVSWRETWPRETIRYTVQCVALFPIFRTAIRYPDFAPFRPLNWGWVRTLGVYSYAIYLIHHVLIQLFEVRIPAARHPAVMVPLVLALSVVFAAFVERVVESRMRVVRARLR